MRKAKMSFGAERPRCKVATHTPNDQNSIYNVRTTVQVAFFTLLLFFGGCDFASAQADAPVWIPARTQSASDVCRSLVGLERVKPEPKFPHQVMIPYVSFGELLCDLFPQGTIALGRVGESAMVAIGESRGIARAVLYDVAVRPEVDTSKINAEVDPAFLREIFSYDGPLSGRWVMLGTYPIEPELPVTGAPFAAQTPDPSQWLQYVVGEVLDMFSKSSENFIYVPGTVLVNTIPSFDTSIPAVQVCPQAHFGTFRFNVLVPVWLPQENTWMVAGTWDPSGLPMICSSIYPYVWIVGPQAFNYIPRDVREPLVEEAERSARDYEIDLWALPAGSLQPEMTPARATFTVIGGAMVAYAAMGGGGSLPVGGGGASVVFYDGIMTPRAQAASPDAEIGIVFWDMDGNYVQGNPNFEKGIPGVKLWGSGDPDTFAISGTYGQWKLPTIAGDKLMCEYQGKIGQCRSVRDGLNFISVSYLPPHRQYLPMIAK